MRYSGIACLMFILVVLFTLFIILLESAAWKQSFSSSAMTMSSSSSSSTDNNVIATNNNQQQQSYALSQRQKEIGNALMHITNVFTQSFPSPSLETSNQITKTKGKVGDVEKLKETLLLTESLSNRTYNPCKSPYQYACYLANQATVQDIADSENFELETKVLKSDMIPHPFYAKCVKFVNTRNIIPFLSTDADFLQIIEIIRKRANILEFAKSQSLYHQQTNDKIKDGSNGGIDEDNIINNDTTTTTTTTASGSINPEELYHELSKKINLREPFALHLQFTASKSEKEHSAFLNIEYDIDYGQLNNDKRISAFIAELLEAVYFKSHQFQGFNRKRINGNTNEIIYNAMTIHQALFPPKTSLSSEKSRVLLEDLSVAEANTIAELFPELIKARQKHFKQGQEEKGQEARLSYWSLPIYVNRDDLRRYIRARHMFPRKNWINYMFFTALKTFLQQLMTFGAFLSDSSSYPPESEQKQIHICQKRFKELFPIRYCHWVRDRIHPNVNRLELFINELISEWNQWTYEQNPFKLTPEQQIELQKYLHELKIYLAQCTIENSFVKKTKEHFGETNQRIFEIENNLLGMGHLSYVKWIWKIFQTPEITIRRHSGLKIYTEINDFFAVGWNAWYQIDLHAIVFPPGTLNFITTHLYPESCQMHAVAGTLFFHEIFHAIQRKIETFGSPVALKFQKCLSDRYAKLPESDDGKLKSDPEENAADYIALRIAFLNWQRKLKYSKNKQKDIRCFLISYVQTFCGADDDFTDDIHAKNIQRALYPIAEMLQSEWESTFQCPPTRSFLGIQKKDKCL